MNNRNLMHRLKRLERQLQPQVEDIKHADIEVMRRLNQARRRLALEGDERYAAYRDLPEPELPAPSRATEIVMRLHAARKRVNQENEVARKTEGAAAATEEIETTEP